MWLKLCLLLIYITVLFVLARLVEALTWYETGSLSRRLLDPMTLSVAKLKALLEQRGVSYDTVVEKAELTQLVEGSGTVHEDEVAMELLQSSDETPASANTNFTSGAHFYEQVEDAKDSVWLVQVIARHSYRSHLHPSHLSEATWKSIRKKVTKFGVHTGVLDCELDPLWCERRGWHSSHLLLALPQVYKQKANVATHTYQGPLRQNAISHWIRRKLHEKIETIQDFRRFKDEWLTFKNAWQESEVRVLLFTDQDSIPMFFSALSVKFPGRVKFGVVNANNGSTQEWTQAFLPQANTSLPLYLVITNEGPYVYGKNQGDCLTFSSMETLLKFLYPCLNDIFIFSFLVANMASVLEFFIAQSGVWRRLRRFLWCVVKYNAAVIMLWLPLIAIFQLPYLDHLPLLGLKFSRLLATSPLGEAVRRDFFFHSQHPYLLAASFLFACSIFGILAYKVTGGRYEEDEEPWFNFAQMRTLTHLRSNEFFEPMFMSGYELSGGMEIFGSRLYLPTMSLQPVVSPQYIGLLPTWQYCSRLKSTHRCCQACSSDQHHEDRNSKMENSHGILDSLDIDHDCREGLPPSGSSVPESQSQLYSCTASASDLMDGNYHCECHDRARRRSSSEPALSSAQSQGDSIPITSTESISSQTSDSLFSSNTTGCMTCHQCLQGQSSTTTNTASATNTSGTKETSGHGAESSSGCSAESQTTSSAESLDFPEGYLPCSQCVICLEEYAVDIMLCGLPCGHVFHHSCILTWLKRDHHFCPVCRWPSFRPRPQLVHAHAE